jgi:hypothetical protein
MHNAAFLARQNEYLRAANEKKNIRKQGSQRQLAYQGSLDASEIEALAEPPEASTCTPHSAPNREKTGAQARTREPKQCSGRRSLDHTYNRCPAR